MAYEPDKLNFMSAPISGSFRLWTYDGTDNAAAMAATDYFSDASDKGLQVGDIIFASEPDGTGSAILGVTAVDSDGNGTAATFFALPADDSITFAKMAYGIQGVTTSAADSLAIPVTHAVVTKTTGGDAEACTLANGVAGQKLLIHLGTDGGGTATVTPATKTGFVSIALADAGDNVSLLYVDDTVGWVILGAAGVAAPPAIALS